MRGRASCGKDGFVSIHRSLSARLGLTSVLIDEWVRHVREVVAAVEVDAIPARLAQRNVEVSRDLERTRASGPTGKRISPRRPFGQLYGGKYGWRVSATSAPRLDRAERYERSQHDQEHVAGGVPVPPDRFRSQRVLVRALEGVASQHPEAVRESRNVCRVGLVITLQVVDQETSSGPVDVGEGSIGPVKVPIRAASGGSGSRSGRTESAVSFLQLRRPVGGPGRARTDSSAWITDRQCRGRLTDLA